MSQIALSAIGLKGDASKTAFLAAIVNSSDDAIIGKTVDGLITSWNSAAERMYGYSAAEVLGLPITILEPESHVGEISGFLKNIARGRSIVHHETLRLKKDGTTVPVSVTISPVRDNSGSVVGASSIARDISERHLALRVQLRVEELERANRNLEAFTYCVSHDLRAPLRALSGFSTALLEEYGDNLDETGRDYAMRIEVASERMSDLIDDLLDLSRISRAVVHPEELDLSKEATEIALVLQQRDPDRTVQFDIAEGINVTADRSLMRTLMENLLANAWKFTSAQETATIEFGSTCDAARARIIYYVRDNGAGFDPQYMSKLFKPFQRLHSSNEFPGTGVGLASVKQVIELHAGDLWAEGEAGKGATFYFTLSARREG